MRAKVLALGLIGAMCAGCVSMPRLKHPDEGERVPVNKVTPPEAEEGADRGGKPGRAEADGVEWRAGVEWR